MMTNGQALLSLKQYVSFTLCGVHLIFTAIQFCEVSSGTQEHAPGKDNYAQESPRQPKAALQKEYRKRESESESELFDQLQGYIGSMTKHQPDTRQDILAEGGFY